MEEINIIISIYSLVVSSFISLLTIFVNIRLTRYTISKNNKNKAYDQHKEALIKYYLPIKLNLIKLDYILRDTDGKYFNMFELYKTDVAKAKKRNDIITVYNDFMTNYNALPLYFTNEDIDKNIVKVYEHILTILMNETNVNSIGFYKKTFEMPDLQEVITSINNYSLAHETYDSQGIWSKIKKRFST